jgi:hypothetical protein
MAAIRAMTTFFHTLFIADFPNAFNLTAPVFICRLILPDSCQNSKPPAYFYAGFSFNLFVRIPAPNSRTHQGRLLQAARQKHPTCHGRFARFDPTVSKRALKIADFSGKMMFMMTHENFRLDGISPNIVTVIRSRP